MKILFAHVFHAAGVDEWYKDIASTAGEHLEVDCFCVTLNPPGPVLSWAELDLRWKRKEKQLMQMYAQLQEAASACDVFLLYNGANIHPDFLQYLPTFNVYCCFDDPENSANLSAPVAKAFDAVFYGNIGSRFQYESWGCSRLAWLPIFTAPRDIPSFQDGEKYLQAKRDVPVCYIGEKNFYKRRRLDTLSNAFPSSQCFGSGWGGGYVDESKKAEIYRRSKIGWNLHNSTGPINRRLFTLPAYGVMQICDNKTGLGHIFQLGVEAVGFDTISEAIELTQYYLEHEDDRLIIAENGFRRFWEDYHPTAIWARVARQINEWHTVEKISSKRSPLPRKHFSHSLISAGKKPLHMSLTLVENIKRMSCNIVCREKVLDDQRLQFEEGVCLEERISPYVENPEMKGVNMAKERLAHGEPFEWPNMLALNWAATSLIGNAKRIVEIGSGTGPFAEFASAVPDRELICVEEDDFARSWAQENRAHPNVSYVKHLQAKNKDEFELLVSIDVFEHVNDMRGFLDFCSQLAPRAIFSTPNREVVRGGEDMGPPTYAPHVREFSPGELYWILRQYYRDVFLFYMPDVYVPQLLPMNILTKGTPIIAECWNSFGGVDSH